MPESKLFNTTSYKEIKLTLISAGDMTADNDN